MTRTTLLGSALPIVAAPMAGGPTTVALARAVASAGGFPFLAGGYKTAEQLGGEITELAATGTAFGVNLFVPQPVEVDANALARYAERLAPEAARYGVELPRDPAADDDHWGAKLELLLEHPVPVVSFTFALPPRDAVAALQRAGSRVLVSVTNAAEAQAAAGLAVDGLVLQGADAGGHSATLNPARLPERMPLPELVQTVRRAVDLPVIAAGGIDSADAVRAVVDAGAVAAAVGTLLLRTNEAGTSAVHRAALADAQFTETTMTYAFTGRPARALRNEFIAEYESAAPHEYPAVHHLTRPIRQAAAKAGDPHRVHLWAGTGYRSAPTGSATDVIRSLAPR